MDFAASIIGLINLFFAVVIGLYFWNLLRSQQGNKVAVEREAKKEMERLRRLRSISLTEPLAERTRPADLSEIIGQEEGLRALRACLCGPNPQHVLIYGPPGVGKTAAARVVLEEAKKNPLSPFKENAKFVELDATTARFDERGIADPLIGSVHDPIYQGAGPLGIAGIPQPKPGAVTKAHGGVLFIDEIGELHPVQLNKLLKVLEDRKVFLESAYYNAEDTNIPHHIHDIFQNGLPADFRLIGATTRMPSEISPAIRSRCVEIFFRDLTPEEIGRIAVNALKKVGLQDEDGALEVLVKYATNGRDAVNIIQIAAGLALTEGRTAVRRADIEWIVQSGQYAPRADRRVPESPQIGLANGLAVIGPNLGLLIPIEVAAIPVPRGTGRLTATGLVEEEELGEVGRKMRRRSMAKGAVENVLTAIRYCLGLDPRDFDLHINFPGCIPVDGPSAGASLLVAVYSAITGRPVDNKTAVTGEVSIRGRLLPVGGVVPKVEAAKRAGAGRVLIPKENWQDLFRMEKGIEIVAVETVAELVALALVSEEEQMVPYRLKESDAVGAGEGGRL